jgi:hypothetical protein
MYMIRPESEHRHEGNEVQKQGNVPGERIGNWFAEDDLKNAPKHLRSEPKKATACHEEQKHPCEIVLRTSSATSSANCVSAQQSQCTALDEVTKAGEHISLRKETGDEDLRAEQCSRTSCIRRLF